jgi:hypothetical protein
VTNCVISALIVLAMFVISLRVTAYLEHMLEAVYGALEGLNKQAFMTELVLLSHPQMTVPFMICDLNLVATFE